MLRRPHADGIIEKAAGRLRNAAALLIALSKRRREPRGGGDAERAKPHPWEASYPEGLSWNVDIETRPLFAILDDALAAHPEKPCLEFLGKGYSYAEIGDLVARAAKGFAELGVGKGVNVGLFLPNSPYYVICYYAILKAGGTVVNFNPLYAARETARQIRDSETRIMVTLNLRGLYPKLAGRLDDTCLEKIVVCRMSGALPFPGNALFALFKRKETAAIPADERHVKFEKLIANDGRPAPPEIDPDRDVAVLQFTGGTTGHPKAAMLTHGNLYANAVQTSLWTAGMKPEKEKFLGVLPLFHVFGMTAVMNVGLHRGAEIVLLPRFKVGEVLKAIDKERPTVFMGVPTMYSSINGHKDLGKYDLSSLIFCISGGAPLPLAVKETFESLTGCTLVEGYGLTEAGPICTINPLTGINKPGSIGLPVPGTTIEITSLRRPKRRVRLSEHGEICVSGPQVMAGYWRHQDETEAVLRGARLHTGDVGYMDEDGYVFLIDRIKDLIITGGFNVYPRTVEEAIHLHPAVAEAAVCGVPDQHRGEIVKAYVRLCDGESLAAGELRAFLEDKLAPFEMPRRIEFRDDLPRTLVGKPSRRRLLVEELRKMARRRARSAARAGKRRPSRAPDSGSDGKVGRSAG